MQKNYITTLPCYKSKTIKLKTTFLKYKSFSNYNSFNAMCQYRIINLCKYLLKLFKQLNCNDINNIHNYLMHKNETPPKSRW